jgi:Phage integrase, N-terminal SAM-like domain
MSNLPVLIGGTEFAASDPLARAADYAAAEKSDATRRAYWSDFLHFAAWCEHAGREALPASIETAAAYLAALADGGLKASTITRRCAAIAYAHRLKGFEPPNASPAVSASSRQAWTSMWLELRDAPRHSYPGAHNRVVSDKCPSWKEFLSAYEEPTAHHRD